MNEKRLDLRVGIATSHENQKNYQGFIKILGQEGIPYNLINLDERSWKEFRSHVIIIAPNLSHLTSKAFQEIKKYVRTGGILLSTGYSFFDGTDSMLTELFSISHNGTRTFVEKLLPRNDFFLGKAQLISKNIHYYYDAIQIKKKGNRAKTICYLYNEKGDEWPGIVINKLDSGYAIYSSIFLGAVQFNYKYGEKVVDGVGKNFTIKCSIVDHGKIRRLVRGIIEWGYIKRNCPLPRVYYWPGEKRSVLNVRVDVDEDQNLDLGVRNALNILKKHEVRASFYVQAGPQRIHRLSIHRNLRLLGYYGLLKFIHYYLRGWTKPFIHEHTEVLREIDKRGHELGAHGWIHEWENLSSVSGEILKEWIGKNKQSFDKEVGVRVDSFAAPFGMWSEQALSLLEEEGFLCSSDGCLEVDDLPYYPIIFKSDGKFKKYSLLEVPLEPFYDGNFLNSGHNEKNLLAMFKKMLVHKMKLNEMCVICIHASHKKTCDSYPYVLDEFLGYAKKQRSLWITTIQEIAKWWKEREKMNIKDVSYSITDRILEIELEEPISNSNIEIKLPTGKKSIFIPISPKNKGIRLKMSMKSPNALE